MMFTTHLAIVLILGLSTVRPMCSSGSMSHSNADVASMSCNDSSMAHSVRWLHLSQAHHDHMHLMSVKSVVIAGLEKLRQFQGWLTDKVTWASLQLVHGIGIAAHKALDLTRESVDSSLNMLLHALEHQKHRVELKGIADDSCVQGLAELKKIPDEELAKVDICVSKVTDEGHKIVQKAKEEIKEMQQVYNDLETDVQNCDNAWYCIFSIATSVVSNVAQIALKVPKIAADVTKGVSNEIQIVSTCGKDIANEGIAKVKNEAETISNCFNELLETI